MLRKTCFLCFPSTEIAITEGPRLTTVPLQKQLVFSSLHVTFQLTKCENQLQMCGSSWIRRGAHHSQTVWDEFCCSLRLNSTQI